MPCKANNLQAPIPHRCPNRLFCSRIVRLGQKLLSCVVKSLFASGLTRYALLLAALFGLSPLVSARTVRSGTPQVYRSYRPARVTITVEDKETKDPLIGATWSRSMSGADTLRGTTSKEDFYPHCSPSTSATLHLPRFGRSGGLLPRVTSPIRCGSAAAEFGACIEVKGGRRAVDRPGRGRGQADRHGL